MTRRAPRATPITIVHECQRRLQTCPLRKPPNATPSCSNEFLPSKHHHLETMQTCMATSPPGHEASVVTVRSAHEATPARAPQPLRVPTQPYDGKGERPAFTRQTLHAKVPQHSLRACLRTGRSLSKHPPVARHRSGNPHTNSRPETLPAASKPVPTPKDLAFSPSKTCPLNVARNRILVMPDVPAQTMTLVGYTLAILHFATALHVRRGPHGAPGVGCHRGTGERRARASSGSMLQ